MVGLSACGLPSNVVVLIPDEAERLAGSPSSGTNAKDELSVSVYGGGDRCRGKALGVFATDEKTVDTEFAGALAGTPRKPVIYVIFFLNGQTVWIRARPIR